MKIRTYFSICSIILLTQALVAGDYLQYQVRLEPVWSRVADVYGEAGSVESAEFSPNGKYIVTGTKFDNSVIMWRTSDGAELWRQYHAHEVERVGWSADGKYVAACSEDHVVSVYHAKSGKKLMDLAHTQGIDGLTWSNKGSLLASGEEMTKNQDGTTDGFIRIFDMPSGKELKVLNFGNTTNELFFSSDDQYLLAAGHGAVKIYNTQTWELEKTLNPSYRVKYITGVFSPDDRYIAASGTSDYAKGTIFLWEWKTGKLLKTLNHTGKKIESLSWHPNGRYILSSGHSPYIFVYRFDDILQYSNDSTPVAHKCWTGDHMEYLDFNADGSFLVSSHQNGLVRLWVWMGEDPELNSVRHTWVKQQQQQ